MYSIQKQITNKNKTNKQITKQRKKTLKKIWKNKISMFLDEACWCCSKLLHLHKKVKKEYQLTRQSSKVAKQQGGEGKRYLKKANNSA
jgi:hypothetical protein